MVADELDVAFDKFEMVMGDTGTTPDQWLTGANLTIFQGGAELRRAAASARSALVARGAARLRVAPEDVNVSDGVIQVKNEPTRKVAYGDLLGAEGFQIKVDPKVTLKKHTDYRVVGKSIPRNVIRTFTCRYNGETVFSARLSSGIAANPYLRFFVTARESGQLTFEWQDDGGVRGGETVAVTVV